MSTLRHHIQNQEVIKPRCLPAAHSRAWKHAGTSSGGWTGTNTPRQVSGLPKMQTAKHSTCSHGWFHASLHRHTGAGGTYRADYKPLQRDELHASREVQLCHNPNENFSKLAVTVGKPSPAAHRFAPWMYRDQR